MITNDDVKDIYAEFVELFEDLSYYYDKCNWWIENISKNNESNSEKLNSDETFKLEVNMYRLVEEASLIKDSADKIEKCAEKYGSYIDKHLYEE